jgi:hypothetical protein
MRRLRTGYAAGNPHGRAKNTALNGACVTRNGALARNTTAKPTAYATRNGAGS